MLYNVLYSAQSWLTALHTMLDPAQAHYRHTAQQYPPTSSSWLLSCEIVLSTVWQPRQFFCCLFQSPQYFRWWQTVGKWLDNHEAHTDQSRGVLLLHHQEHLPRLHWSGHCPQIFPAAGTAIVRRVSVYFTKLEIKTLRVAASSHPGSTITFSHLHLTVIKFFK